MSKSQLYTTAPVAIFLSFLFLVAGVIASPKSIQLKIDTPLGRLLLTTSERAIE